MSLISRALGGACVLLAASALGACASRPTPLAPVATASTPPPPAAAPYAAPAPSAPIAEAPMASVAPGTVQDFVIHAGDRVYFDTNKFNLRDQARQTLDAQAAWLERYPDVRVRIEGNCDDRGTEEYNFALGARRASRVKDYLVGRGVSPSRITTVSYGKERPIDPEDTEAAWAKNRNARTDIVEGARPG